MKRTIEEIDRNFIIQTGCRRDNVRVYSALEPPCSLHGLLPPDEKEPLFRRLPRQAARQVSAGVLDLHAHCAGGRVRFCTDSAYIAIEARMGSVGKMPHFALTGSAGFDLYAGTAHLATFQPRLDISDRLFGQTELKTRRMRELTLNFPLYSEVKELYILLEEDALLLPAAPYPLPPAVFYGSSITQGGCASRPGTAYPAVVCRRLGLDHVNLGFSGSALGERAMADYLAGLPMCAFVLDYDHNAPSAHRLAATYGSLFRAVRETHPHIPILCLSRPTDLAPDRTERLRVMTETVAGARSAGDDRVRFMDMREYLEQAGVLEEASVDGSHPNDLGFYVMARVVEAFLREMLPL